MAWPAPIGGGTTEIMYEIISKLVVDDIKHERVMMAAHGK